MQEEENKIIDAEVEEVRYDSKEAPKEPKKPIGDHRAAIQSLQSFESIALRYSLTGLILSLLAGLCFSILSSQISSSDTPYFWLSITCWIFAGFFFLLFVAGFVCRFIKHKLMASDPNYSGGNIDD